MPGIENFWLFLLAGLALNVTPGPDTAFVIAQSALPVSRIRQGATARRRSP
jgi:threonine/homoserine/homoserine lactone efflux protein